MPLLSITGLNISYNHIPVVRGISFEVQEGEIVTLIGANGAGKSSILRALSGMIPYRGEVVFNGRNLRGLTPDRILAAGIAHVPEGRGIFGNLTVRENLKLATWLRKGRRAVAEDYERVYSLFPRLNERAKQSAGTLSGGEQQMLALGRALMSGARLLLLDEPSMGLAPVLVRDIFKVLGEINRAGTTILLVEQNARMALRLASRAYVLESGNLVLSGPSQDLADNPKIKEAYLGG